MTARETLRLDAEARAILKENDRGGYTIPTKGLYPFQWNWDSALVALGYAAFDPGRAWQEIETLLKAQWDTGMVPHIVFWREDAGYFPGPGEWGTHTTPPTSGITQPPVAASVMRRLFERPARPDGARLGAMLVAIDRWHQWFSDARDPDGEGLVAIIHPWESGRDNLPDWDYPMSFVDVSNVGTYERRDTQHIDAGQRPAKTDYDRYMALVQFGRTNAWDDEIIAANSPFWVADVGTNAILRRAEQDLAWLANANGQTGLAERAQQRCARLNKGFSSLWQKNLGGYVSKDLRRGRLADALTAGSWLALYAGEPDGARVALMADKLDQWLAPVGFGLPSFDPGHPLFDPILYWRGPVWAIINRLVADGLVRAGLTGLAERIRADTEALIRQTGFYEYFNPITAEGGGGDSFSWTAAMWLDWASPSATETGVTKV